MKLARESWALAVICTVDLITTIYLVQNHGAAEANPVMRYFLELGYVAFIIAKAFMFVIPLAILEWARRRQPAFVRGMLRVGIVLYLGSYGAVVWRINARADGEAYTPEETVAIEKECSKPAQGYTDRPVRNRNTRIASGE